MLCKTFKLFAPLLVALGVASMSGGRAQAAPTNTGEPASVQIVRRVPLPLSRKPAPKKASAEEGDYIDRVFVERKTHRVLVQVRHKPEQIYGLNDKLYWIKRGAVSRCFDWPHATGGVDMYMELAAADLNAGLLYYVAYNGGYLNVINRKGEAGVSPELPGRLCCLVNGAKPGHAYWGFDDYNTDVSFGGWIGIYGDGPRMERRSVGETPSQLLYSASEDDIVMLRDRDWRLLNGKPHVYPKVTLPSDALLPASHQWSDTRLSVGAADLDATGQYLCYADHDGHALHKIRVKDGAILETRKLPFVVSALAVDSDSDLIHLVDWQNHRVVTVKSF